MKEDTMKWSLPVVKYVKSGAAERPHVRATNEAESIRARLVRCGQRGSRPTAVTIGCVRHTAGYYCRPGCQLL